MNSVENDSALAMAEELSATEIAVASIWNEVLQNTDRLDPNANFFSLGGDSMGMVLVEFRIKEELSVDLPPGSLLATKSLRDLSALIDSQLSAAQKMNE